MSFPKLKKANRPFPANSGLHQEERCLQIKDFLSSLLSAVKATLGVVCPVMGFPVQEET